MTFLNFHFDVPFMFCLLNVCFSHLSIRILCSSIAMVKANIPQFNVLRLFLFLWRSLILIPCSPFYCFYLIFDFDWSIFFSFLIFSGIFISFPCKRIWIGNQSLLCFCLFVEANRTWVYFLYSLTSVFFLCSKG